MKLYIYAQLWYTVVEYKDAFNQATLTRRQNNNHGNLQAPFTVGLAHVGLLPVQQGDRAGAAARPVQGHIASYLRQVPV